MIATWVHLDIFLKNFMFSLLYKRVQANACHDKSTSRKQHVLAVRARFLQKCPWLIVTCTDGSSTTEGCRCSLTAFFWLYCSVFKHCCRFLQSELKCTGNRLAFFVTVCGSHNKVNWFSCNCLSQIKIHYSGIFQVCPGTSVLLALKLWKSTLHHLTGYMGEKMHLLIDMDLH